MIKGSQGFSLVEAMISVVVVTLLFLGLVTAIGGYLDSQRLLEAQSAAGRLAQMMQERLLDEDSCTSAIQNVDFDTVAAQRNDLKRGLPIAFTIPHIRDRDITDNDRIAAGVILREYNIRIESLNLYGATHMGRLTLNGNTYNLWRVNLAMQPQARTVQRTNVGMAPRVIGSFHIGVRGGRVERCLNANYEPVKRCARQAKFYAPWGFRAKDRNYPADPETGCVSHEAYMGMGN